MAKSVEEMKDSMWENLTEKTGKSRAAWIELAAASGIMKHRDLVSYLKAEFGITHGYANAVALAALTSESEANLSSDDQISSLFTGTKAAARPIYDALVAAIYGLGGDVDFSPKKNYVSVRRKKQFAILQPSAGRIDLGLVLKSAESIGRLETSGSFNAMLTHRVRVLTVEEVNDELAIWLRQAYDEA